MPRLVTLRAAGDNGVQGLSSPRLKHASIDMEHQTWLPREAVPNAIEYLQIWRAGGRARISSLVDLTHLKTLRVADTRELDISDLGSARSLQWLDIARVRVLGGVSALARLTSLTEVNLSGIGDILDWQGLAKVGVPRLTVEGNRSIPVEAASVWAAENPGWSTSKLRPTA